jgi:hypothetical protein
MDSLALVLSLAATSYMTGVAWLVQLIQYPDFAQIPPERFVQYHQRYTFRMGFVVVPMMLMELAATAYLVVFVGGPLVFLGAGLLGIVWFNTFFQIVPLHNNLALGFDPAVHCRLCRLNLVRTLAWSGRMLIGVILFIESAAPI